MAMDAVSKAFLERLLNAASPSGYESEAAAVIKEEAGKFADRISVDLHGNVSVIVNEGGGPRVMLAGHMDEIGLQIVNIDDNGFLRFKPIGGWDPQILQGQRVWIAKEGRRIPGVIGKKPIHLLSEEQRKNVVKIDDMWIDIGAKSADEARALVAVGDCAVLAHTPEWYPNDLLVARGLDDRCGAFVVIEAARLAAKLNPKAEIHAVATVQEELGLRGATTSAYHTNPVVGIAVDVTHATDYPSMGDYRERNGSVELGGGPVVSRGPNMNPRVVERLLATAEAQGIPVQLDAQPRGTGTDANAMQLSRGGIATALVSIPNRYMHTPVEMVNTKDLIWAATLLAHTVAAIDDEQAFIPW